MEYKRSTVEYKWSTDGVQWSTSGVREVRWSTGVPEYRLFPLDVARLIKDLKVEEYIPGIVHRKRACLLADGDEFLFNKYLLL